MLFLSLYFTMLLLEQLQAGIATVPTDATSHKNVAV